MVKLDKNVFGPILGRLSGQSQGKGWSPGGQESEYFEKNAPLVQGSSHYSHEFSQEDLEFFFVYWKKSAC
jgi:hypothetical protein